RIVKIELNISGNADQGLVSLAWTVEECRQRPYAVSKDCLVRAASDVRDILDKVTEADDFACLDPFELFKAELCKAGSILFSSLFDAVDGDRLTASNVLEYFSEAPPRDTSL